MVLGAYYPEISGGGLQGRALMGRLRDRVDFTVLTTSAVSNESMEVDGIPVHRIRVDPKALASRCRGLVRLARLWPGLSRAATIVHLQSVSQKNILLTWLATCYGKQLLLTLHTGGHDDAIRLKRENRWLFEAMRRADIVTAVSPALLQAAKESGLPARLEWVPNGVDLERFRPVAPGERPTLRARLSLPQEKTLILFVGFFSREKGPQRLFDAWQGLPAANRERSTLVFVGPTSGPHVEIDSTLARLIREQAGAIGAAPVFVESTHHIEQYYQAADLFVLPSSREGFPVALLEAMATGLPVISSDLPGVTDTLVVDRVNGLVIPAGDVDTLRGAIQHVLDSPDEAARLGAAARSTIAASFSLDSAAETYWNLYTALMSRS